MRIGDELSRQALKDALNKETEGRFNEDILDKVNRNAASSWTQSGHLAGRGRKKRQKVKATPVAVVFALLLGYLAGERGQNLFTTLWAKILDTTQDELIYLAMDAKRAGLLEMSQAGGVIEIGFSRLLTAREKDLIHG